MLWPFYTHVSASGSSQQQEEAFEGGFLQRPPPPAHGRPTHAQAQGRPTHIQLEGFQPGESDDGVLNNRYVIHKQEYVTKKIGMLPL